MPIQRKLTLIILLTCSVALLLACAALFVFQTLTFRQDFVRDLDGVAQIIADNSTAALTFKDRRSAEDVLASLKAKPHIVSADIELKNGSMFAHYGVLQPSSEIGIQGVADGMRKYGDYLVLSSPIELENKRLGTLRLWSDYGSQFRGLLTLYAGILLAVLLVSILLAYLLSTRLQRVISDPILELANTAQKIAAGHDYSLRAENLGRDEVGRLTQAFNEMLSQIQRNDQELERVNKQLIETSRQAGMAEVATGVLHNVGNVLTSVNVSIILIREKLLGSEVANLGKLRNLLQQHESDLESFLMTDPKGKLVPGFIVNLTGSLTEENAALLAEHEHLARNVDHIKEIVAMQQNYARVSGAMEEVPIARLVEDALAINAEALTRHGVTVFRRYSEVPLVLVDRHKVLQILVNLVRNAKYAMDGALSSEKRLTACISLNGENRIIVTVSDNGIGIPPENLTRIFSHGFTTRKDGHGFGLHSGANAAKEMGGQLTASSEGLGKGATFTLEFPINIQKG